MTGTYSELLELTIRSITADAKALSASLSAATLAAPDRIPSPSGLRGAMAAAEARAKAIARRCALLDLEGLLEIALAMDGLAVDACAELDRGGSKDWGKPQGKLAESRIAAIVEGAKLIANEAEGLRIAKDYGSFISPNGSISRTIRPESQKPEEFAKRAKLLFSHADGRVPIERLSLIQGERSYRMGFQASLLASIRLKGRALSLVCVDLARLEEKDLESISSLFEGFEAGGDLVQHGPLELPLDVFGSDHPQFPYYLLLNTKSAPEGWLAERAIPARVLKHFIRERKPEVKVAAYAVATPRDVLTESPKEKASGGLLHKAEHISPRGTNEAKSVQPSEDFSASDFNFNDFTEGDRAAIGADAKDAGAKDAGSATKPKSDLFAPIAASHNASGGTLAAGDIALLQYSQGAEELFETEALLTRYEIDLNEDPASLPANKRQNKKAERRETERGGKADEADAANKERRASRKDRRSGDRRVADPSFVYKGKERRGQGKDRRSGDRRARSERSVEDSALELAKLRERNAKRSLAGLDKPDTQAEDELIKQELAKIRIRRPIAMKMIVIISLLVIGALSGMIFLASYFFKLDTQAQIESNNLTLTKSLSKGISEVFESLTDKAKRLAMDAQSLAMQKAEAQVGSLSAEETAQTISNESQILYIALEPSDPLVPGAQLYNEDVLAAKGLSHDEIDAAILSSGNVKKKALGGEIQVENVSAPFKEGVTLVAQPASVNGKPAVLLYLAATQDRFSSLVEKSGLATISIVNANGILLANPDATYVIAQANQSKVGIVARMKKSLLLSESVEYSDETGASYLGAFCKSSFASVAAISVVPAKEAFGMVETIQNRNILIMVIVLALALLIVYFFSRSLSEPIRGLVKAAQRIKLGDFNLDLETKSKDEIGMLTNAFNDMGKGLGEREKLRDNLIKFSSKEIAEKAANGELELGGERKFCTIFFSDIRSFTAISENLEPEEVVDFLNKYMTRMVACVNKTGGYVNKFIGDAIMAIWGTPTPYENHAERAVNASLMMRKSLMEFNIGRGDSAKNPIIKIGCGMNSGPVTAGQIGSEERLEYTVIGDAVNLASRIESTNKAFGTDILISQDTYDFVKDIFKVEPMKPLTVKGKTEPQQLYAVLGRLDDPECPESLAAVQDMLGIEHKDISKANVDEEEVKFKVIDDKKTEGKA